MEGRPDGKEVGGVRRLGCAGASLREKPGKADGLTRYRQQQQQQQHTKRIFNKNKYDSQKSMRREREREGRKNWKKKTQNTTPTTQPISKTKKTKAGKQVSARASRPSLSQGGEEEVQRLGHHSPELD